METQQVTQLEEEPVTAGGLVIREPSPRNRALERSASPTMSSQVGALIVRPASNNARSDAHQSRSHRSSEIVPLPISNEPPTRNWFPRVTAETVTDEEAGPYRPNSPFSYSTGYGPEQRPSPESEERDSGFGNPAAQSTAQNALRNETRLHSARSQSTAGNTSRFSRRPASVERVLRVHTSRAETRAQTAYEQNRAALHLISQSMDNVKGAYTEARRARD